MRLAAPFAALLLATAIATPLAAGPGMAPLPANLRDTGLFAPGSGEVRASHVSFTPQYPLWSDGAAKQRWLALPPGKRVDAARPDAWEFPRGTRLWKQFGYERPVETRFIERLADGSWRYAVYVWNDAGTEATLAPAEGIPDLPVKGAPGGRYAVPSRDDCRACHEGTAVPVLGFTALQLSHDRDAMAAHAEPARPEHATLASLASLGALRGLPAALLSSAPRIPASNPTERAALGYLHGNCGHCHNDGALSGVALVLAHEAARPAQSYARVVGSLVGRASRFRPHGAAEVRRVVPGDAASSVLALRMKSHNPAARMPPLGTQALDAEGIALIERWIQQLQDRKETSP